MATEVYITSYFIKNDIILPTYSELIGKFIDTMHTKIKFIFVDHILD